jgi:Raf kinase inhibitor-like YbhB/YbcL family protein
MQGTMWRSLGLSAVACLLLVLGAGCSAESKLASNSDLSGGLWTIAVNSSAFKQMEAIPEKYAADGMNTSPPLKWSKGPNLLKEWALIVQDADEKLEDGYPATLWSVYRIPANVTELPEGASKSMSYPQGKNYKGENGYVGPSAKPGKRHRIYFQVFALDEPQDIPAGADRETIRKLFKGHVLSKGILIGTYTGPEEKK